MISARFDYWPAAARDAIAAFLANDEGWDFEATSGLPVPSAIGAVELPAGRMAVLGQVRPGTDISDLHAGMQVELLACNEECARGPNQPLDFLDRLVIDAPRPLSAADLKQPLRMQVKISGTDMAPALSLIHI